MSSNARSRGRPTKSAEEKKKVKQASDRRRNLRSKSEKPQASSDTTTLSKGVPHTSDHTVCSLYFISYTLIIQH